MSAGHRRLIVRYKGGGIRNIRSETLCHMLNIAVDERRAKHCRTKYRRSLNACLPVCRWSGPRVRVKEASGRTCCQMARGGFWGRRSGFTSNSSALLGPMIMTENRSIWTVAAAEHTPVLKMAGFDQCLGRYMARITTKW